MEVVLAYERNPLVQLRLIVLYFLAGAGSS